MDAEIFEIMVAAIENRNRAPCLVMSKMIKFIRLHSLLGFYSLNGYSFRNPLISLINISFDTPMQD